jgi:hypothetical protein
VTKPFTFPEPAYQAGAAPDVIEKEASAIATRTKPVSDTGLQLDQMDNDELRTELSVIEQVKNSLKEAQGYNLEQKKELLTAAGIDPNYPGVSQILNEGKLNRHAKDVHRMLALNLSRQPRSVTAPAQQLEPAKPSDQAVREAKDRLNYDIQQLEIAAKRLEDSKEPEMVEVASRLRNRASGMKEVAKRPVVQEQDVNMMAEASAPELTVAYKTINAKLTPEEAQEYLDKSDL